VTTPAAGSSPSLLRERVLCWALLALALLVMVQAARLQWQRVGQPYPGFGVMDLLLVSVGGLDRGGLEPFDLIRAMNGQLLTGGDALQAEVRRHPPGTPFRYLVSRRGELVEVEIKSQRVTRHDFQRYFYEGFVPGLLYLLLGAVVLALKPGAYETRLFLVFCLAWAAIPSLYLDAFSTYRFTRIFLAAFAVLPALQIHLALTFPERRRIVRRHPRLVWVPYVLVAPLAIALQVHTPWIPPAWAFVEPAIGAADWAVSLILLILSLLKTSFSGATALTRQRARVLAAGFTVGQLAPVLGTCVEAVSGVAVPYLNELWRLNFLFPLAVAYAMVRYNLFDLRAVIRIGTIYAAVTGLVVLAYGGAIALTNLAFASVGLAGSQLFSAVIVALAVVVFLNPVYARTQAFVDRVFFRERLDVQASIESLSDRMTTLLDLARIVQLITETVEALFHPSRTTVLMRGEGPDGYRPAAGGDGPAPLAADSALARLLGSRQLAVTHERLEEDPTLREFREAARGEMEALAAEVAVPIFFRRGLTGLLVLGGRRSGLPYTTEDLRLLRILANQSAVALQNARAYTALQAANAQLETALRRVAILESIRANLGKFVPRTVRELIEEAPEAPAFEKREVDVTVLFVDIAGYTRLSEQFDLDTLNQLVERYFGAFLDEILRHGGDVNETAGDGLMVIFRDDDPHRHARAAVLTAVGIARRAREINADLAGVSEPIGLHVGVNSGVAAVGATKIEGAVGARWTYTASGPVTNLAARLASLGAGDTVFIGAETRRRLADDLPLQDLGEHRLKNVEEPVRVFALAADRLEAAATR